MLIARKLHSMEGVNNLLQGRIVGGKDIRGAHYVHGLTLVFTAPSATVTFSSGGAQVPLTAKDVITQIEAQTTNAVRAAFTQDGRLMLRAGTPGAITLASTGTANDDLGFSVGAATTAAPINAPGGGTPEFVTLEAVGTDENSYLIVTNE